MFVSQVRFPRKCTLNRSLHMANLLGNALESSPPGTEGEEEGWGRRKAWAVIPSHLKF